MAAPQPVPAVHAPHLDEASVVGAPQTDTEWFAGFQRHILENAVYEPLREFFPGAPADYLDYGFSQPIHYQARMHCYRTRNGALRDLIIHAVDDYQRHGLRVPPLPDGETRNRLASQLAEKGHVALPAVPSETVSEIMGYLSLQPVLDPRNPDDLLTIDEARKRLNVAQYRCQAILACPHLVEIANDPLLLATVERYLGATPTLLTPSAWWSFAGPEEPKEAQLFHVDFDDFRFCKLFIYLTDVDADSGPHAYLEETHRWPVIDDAQARSPLGPAGFGEWYYEKLRKTDQEVSEYLGREPIHLTGEAGSCFLVDTNGIHKGTLPRKNNRLICQFMYGVTPALQIEPNPLVVPSSESGAVPRRAVETQPFAYVNRFYLCPAEVGDAQARSAATE